MKQDFQLSPERKRLAQRLVAVTRRCIEDPNAHQVIPLQEEVPTRAGCCQMLARLETEGAFGKEFSERFRAPTAAKAALRWVAQKAAFHARHVDDYGGLEPGDLLYKLGTKNNPAGHVGTYLGRFHHPVVGLADWVGENSTTKRGRVRGALGYRTLEQYGAFQIVARPALIAPLASSSKSCEHTVITLNGDELEHVKVEHLAGVREVLESLGWTLMYAKQGRAVTLRAFYEPTKAKSSR